MNETDKKCCPLRPNDGFFYHCLEEDCAWWNKTNQQCCMIRPVSGEESIAHSKVIELAEDCGLTLYDACGNCKQAVRKGWIYCPECGRKLDW